MAERSGFEIAVIGMACRFPGAPNLDAYWDILRDGVESITFFSEEELLAAGVDPDLVRRPDYVKARGMLPDAEMFDAAFFDVTPNEAAAMDPQHRVFLELAWTALEHSGHTPDDFDGVVGVYAGAHENSYAARLHPGSPMVSALGPFATKIGIEKDYLATRVSYKFGLGGPSLSVQTACSTSLVATHLAVQGLLAGECDMALAGGVTVHAMQRSGYLYEPGGIFSPDGHCRSFDAQARGAVSSSGGGVVVLRRLDDALESGDTVHAVILGSAINNDGARRVGYTAPGVSGQARVIRAAQLAAGIPPETISYVEAHGSGTHLGDPIEVAALTNAFRTDTDARGFCSLGSVKSNIGHTHAAAGIAGLIKTVLSLRHRKIPASLHFSTPNPRIDFDASPFRVSTHLAEWSGPSPLRAGVSSFGLGGTNAHVILEEALQPTRADPDEPRWEVITLSARDPETRAAQEKEIGEFLGSHAGVDLTDVANTLQRGRGTFDHRTAVIGRTAADAADTLVGRAPGRLRASQTERVDPEIAFLLPGIGDLSVGTGRELYEEQPVFREHLDMCADILRPLLDLDMRALMLASSGTPRGFDLAALLGRGAMETADDPLVKTLNVQPATFAFEYALAQMWLSWGVRPSALLGYSIGELVAACLAGVFRLEDALLLVTERAKLIERAPVGAMLAVPLPAQRVETWLRGDVWLAVEEGPSLCVVAGTPDAVESLAGHLAEERVLTRPLRTRHAFHCPLLTGAVEDLTALASTVERRPPTIPYLSNVTGDWITDDEAVDSGYWGRHLCEPVRFAQGLSRLWRTPRRVLLEVGPGQALTSAALQALPCEDADGKLAVASMARMFGSQPETAAVLTAAAKLWLAGTDIDWPATRSGPPPRRVPVPTYPFQRRRHWIDGDTTAGARSNTVRRSDPSTWFTVPTWVSSPPPPDAVLASRKKWLVILDPLGVGQDLSRRLIELDQDVVVAEPHQDFTRLLEELAGTDRLPDTIVHLGTLYRPGELLDLQDTERCLENGFFNLLALIQSLAGHAADRPLHLAVVTTGAFQVTGDETVIPGNAAVLGPCRVLSQEHPRWTARCVDVRMDGRDPSRLAEILVRELANPLGPRVVAYRGTRRWLQELRQVRVDAPRGQTARLRQRGVYLVLGGFGGLGMTLAGFLAEKVGARLVLVGRVSLPPASEWNDWLAAHDVDDRVSRRIRAVRELEARGGEVLPVCADVTDLEQMRAAFQLAERRFGRIDGVIHAAGVLAEGLAQLKDPASASAAMAAKTHGTVVLDTLLRDRRVDFLVLCSSTVGVFGALGQVDYCAASAFLDAYAQRRGSQDGRMTVSVDWDGWRQVGMVAAAAVRADALTDERYPVERVIGHPLLDARQIDGDGRAVYITDLAPERHWVLDEHRMHGHPVVAGTVYLEMMVGAVRDLGYSWPLELRDVVFLTPCVAREGASRRLYLVLEPDGDGHRFTFTSRSPRPGGATPWIHHVSGRVAPVDNDNRPATFAVHDTDVVVVPPHAGPMTLGPRSQCLGEVRVGGEWATAEVVLPQEYRGDLSRMGLHPSLLDIATGFVNMYLSSTFRMPLAYARIRVNGPLPAELTSHVRTREGVDEGRDTAVHDVVLTDAEGRVIVEIDGLTMKRPVDLDARLAALADGSATDVPSYRPDKSDGRVKTPTVLVNTLEHGLTPQEGIAAFVRILHRDLSPQVVVAPRPIEDVTVELSRAWDDPPTGETSGARTHGSGDRAEHPRPALMNEYVAPRTSLERDLVKQWQQLLGITEIGIHDNFSELGGHSLFGVRLASLIREVHHVDLPLSDILAAPTVAQLAELIAQAKEQRSMT